MKSVQGLEKQVDKKLLSDDFFNKQTNVDVAVFLREIYKISPEVYEFVKTEGVVLNNIEELRIFVKNYYLLKNKDEPILTKRGSTNFVISPANFYNAYNSFFWKNLSLEERCRVLYWHFNHQKNAIDPKSKTSLQFLPCDRKWFDSGETKFFGYFIIGEQRTNEIYVSLENLKNPTPTMAFITLEHELTHLIQYNYGEKIKNKKDKNTLYDYTCAYFLKPFGNLGQYFQKFDSFKKNSKMLSSVSYTKSIEEQKANLRALRQFKKTHALNEKEIGKDPRLDLQIKSFEIALNDKLFPSKPADESKEQELSFKIRRNFDYAIKLAYVRAKLNEDNKKLFDQRDNATYSETLKIDEKMEKNDKNIKKIDNIVEKFLQSGNKQRLPKDIEKETEYFVE